MFVFDQKMLTSRDYWVTQLSPPEEMAQLRLDFLRPDVYTAETDKVPIDVTGSAYQQLDNLTNNSAFLLYVTLMTVLKICLYKYSGNPYVVVGSPARQEDAPPQNNVLAIANQLDDQLSFRDCLLQVRQKLLEAYAHQTYPFQRLVQDLELGHIHHKCPLFDVTLVLTDIHTPMPPVPNDVTLIFTQTPDSLSGEIVYHPSLFKRDSIISFARQFLSLLESALADTSQPVAALASLTAEEKRQLLSEWTGTRQSYERELCWHQRLEAQAQQRPEAAAVVFEDDQLTYSALNRRANQLAHYLRRLGVGPDVPAAIYLPRSLEMMIAILGILKAGGAYVPLDPAYPQERLALILENAQVQVVLTNEALRDDLPTQDGCQVCMVLEGDELTAESDKNPSPITHALNLAYLIYTSGSTGVPKGVMVTHRNLLNYSSFILEMLGHTAVSPPLNFATASTINTDLGNTAIFPSLMGGGSLHLLSYRTVTEAERFAHYMDTHQVDVLKITPSHLSALMAAQAGRDILPRKYLILGGEAFSLDLLNRILAFENGVRVINHYGPTETTIGSLTFPVPPDVRRWHVTSVPIGRAIANTNVYVLDQQFQPVPVGCLGELYIGGEGVSRGYVHAPAQTARRFVPNPFAQQPGERLYRSGDVVRVLPDGQIEFRSRVDHQVKIRGFRVELAEVGQALDQHPDIAEQVVLTHQGSGGEHQLAAYVIPQPGKQLTSDELRHFLTQKLPAYMVPTLFIMLDKLPLTPNGKIDRSQLLTLPKQENHLLTSYIAPHTKLEHTLAAVWQHLLQLEQVGTRDNFFDLGGHSLLLIQVHSEIKKQLGRDFPIVDLFRYPTIQSLANYLESQVPEKTPLTQVSELAQKRKAAISQQGRRARKRLKSDGSI